MPGVVWWELESSDPHRTQTFFSALLGWQFRPAFQDTELGADYWTISVGAEVIGGLQRARANSGAPQVGTRLYVEVDELEELLERVVQLGGQVERPRTELGGDDRWFATFTEPTGVSIGLWTARPRRERARRGSHWDKRREVS